MKRLERKETAKWETEECITALQEGGNKEKDEIWWRKKGDRKSVRSGVKVVIAVVKSEEEQIRKSRAGFPLILLSQQCSLNNTQQPLTGSSDWLIGN